MLLVSFCFKANSLSHMQIESETNDCWEFVLPALGRSAQQTLLLLLLLLLTIKLESKTALAHDFIVVQRRCTESLIMAN